MATSLTSKESESIADVSDSGNSGFSGICLRDELRAGEKSTGRALLINILFGCARKKILIYFLFFSNFPEILIRDFPGFPNFNSLG